MFVSLCFEGDQPLMETALSVVYMIAWCWFVDSLGTTTQQVLTLDDFVLGLYSCMKLCGDFRAPLSGFGGCRRRGVRRLQLAVFGP